jgi:uncharacterized protein
MKAPQPTLHFLKALVCLFITQIGFAQFTIPEKPDFQTSVYDYAQVLSANEKAQLEEKLVHYSDSTSTQIVIITIESLKGEDVSQLATNWAQTWGIGQAKEDNGVIILLAKAEKKIAINPGYGLEDRLTAGTGGEISLCLNSKPEVITTAWIKEQTPLLTFLKENTKEHENNIKEKISHYFLLL